MIKRIHVNQHNVRYNAKNTVDLKDVITVKTSYGNYYGSDVMCKGSTRVIYSPDKPLSCGAKVWIEAHGDVVVKGRDGTEVIV